MCEDETEAEVGVWAGVEEAEAEVAEIGMEMGVVELEGAEEDEEDNEDEEVEEVDAREEADAAL